MKPRPYQNECVFNIIDYFKQGNTGNPFVAMPTGTGKSVIPPMIMRWAVRKWPHLKILLLTHVKELIQQNHKALLRYWPTAPAGVFSAGLDKKEHWAPVLLGGIQSVHKSVPAVGHRDMLFIDEAHLLSPNDASMYQQTIAQLREINPNMCVIGLSATPYRMGQGRITDGGLFTDMVFDNTNLDDFNKLIDDRYLMPLVPKRVESMINVSDVRWLANDFNQKDLQETIKKQNVTEQALEETRELAKDRKSWIVFGAGIENCEKIDTMLNKMGIASTFVHSKISDEARESRLCAFKHGHYRAIVSNNILTTGFDHPETDCIVDLRPTTSVVLHVQKYGRGTRPYFHPDWSFEQLESLEGRKEAIAAGGKTNCLVLDFAGNTKRLGPINDPVIPKKKGKGTGEVPVKLCPECGAYNHTVARVCINCGHEFIFKEKLKPTASSHEIIRRVDPKIEIVNVTSMYASVHQKKGKPNTLKVSYYSGVRLFNVWLSFDGAGLAKHKAHEWWRQHQGDDLPSSVAEAKDRFGECRTTKQLKVRTDQKYPDVLEFLF